MTHALLTLLLAFAPASAHPAGEDATPVEHPQVDVRRVSTAIPFPRGLVLEDGKLYVLARGRVRDVGGVDIELDDLAGSLWIVDPNQSDLLDAPGHLAAANGRLLAMPSGPPFRLLDRSLPVATDDHDTDRPYCGLRWHAGSRSFFICAFSGIDLAASDPASAEAGSFRKNFTDAVLRYDTRTGAWSEVERHDPSTWHYPHATDGPPPHGHAKGPDNLLIVADTLLVVAKDNSRLIAYDLQAYLDDPAAAPPPGRVIMEEAIRVDGQPRTVLGHSGLAYRDGWLYIAFRTTSEVIRVPVTSHAAGSFAVDAESAQLLALFDPWEEGSRQPSANLTDIDIGPGGEVYVISAYPARVYRFAPDPGTVHDFRTGGPGQAWADLARITGNAYMKSENVLAAPDGRVFVTSGDAYGHDPGLGGAVYVIQPR